VSGKGVRLLAVVAALSLFAAIPAAAQAKKIITISGSTSVFPLETQLARKWIKTKKGKGVGFKILQGGSNVGIDDVAHGRVSIGASSRDPAPATDPPGLQFTKIARDAICMIVNNSNHLTNITQDQIKGIFLPSPTISLWSQVPGSGISGSIDAIGRAPTSGTHDAFKNIFLGGTNQGSQVAGKASNGLVQQAVQSDPNAIGYVSLAFTSGVKALSYNNVSCDLRNAKSFQYQGVRSFYFVTRGSPVGKVKKFINWVTHSNKANKIVGTDWVPLH
jgi:phosphate transport system substrate-binding protein